MDTPKKSTPKPRRGSGTLQFLTQEELTRLCATITDKRERAILLLAYRYGLRASEIGLLQRTDVDLKQGRITIHRLKGSLAGIYPLQPDVVKLLRSYLRVRTDASPYRFISNRGVPIERRTLWCAMQTYGEQAGLPPEQRQFHWHLPAPDIAALAESFRGRVTVATRDVEAEPQTPERYGMQTLSPLLFFQDGQVVDQLIGVVDRADIAAKLHTLTGTSQA